MRKWINYRDEQETKFDCEVISIVNAHYFITGKKTYSGEYDDLLILTQTKAKESINIKKLQNRLGIKIKKRWKQNKLPKNLFPILPLEIGIIHPSYEFHSILIVDFEPKTESVRVTNFQRETNSEGWMYFENLKTFIIENESYNQFTKI